MRELRNIEFFSDAKGGIMVSSERYGVFTYTQDHKWLTDEMFSLIEERFPKAYKQLTDDYKRSRANIPYFKYLVVHRFIRCNFSKLDKRLDIDGKGNFNFEEVDCPIMCECKSCGVICNPEFNTQLTARQLEVMKLYCQNMEPEEIAERLYMSPDTVLTTKRNAFRKAGVHNIREFMAKYKDIL